MTTEPFCIRFLGTEEAEPLDGIAWGELHVGAFREKFQSDLSYWDRNAYEKQWRRAAAYLPTADKAAFITSMGDPATANFVRCWVMYREGTTVFVQERIIFMDQLDSPFNPEAPEKVLKDRKTMTEDGHPISEWSTSIESIRSFVTGP